MKKMIFSALFLMTISLNAQIFAPIGANWYYSEGGLVSPPNSEYIHYESVKDTIIQDQSTRKIVRIFYSYTGSTKTLSPYFVYDSGDTAFLYNPDKDKFGILYIFNKSKNDTLTLDIPYEADSPHSNQTTYRLVIDSIATETYDEILIKKYKTTGLDDFQFWNDGWFIDYAGGLDWFYPRGIMIPEAAGPLRCYSDNNFSVNFTDKECDYRLINSINIEENQNFKLYPNPAIDKLYISSNNQIENYEIYNNIGLLKIQGSNNIIDLTQLTSGVYWIKIKFRDKMSIYSKILKH